MNPPSIPLQEAVKASDGNLLGDPGRIPLSKRESIKWQRPRFTRQALMRCCLIKWILSSAAPQGSGRTRVTGGREITLSSVFSEATLGHTASTSVGKHVFIHSHSPFANTRALVQDMGTADQNRTQVFQREPGRERQAGG
jgi:hypothetical protein